MTRRERWPRGTPVRPDGRGPGGGRFRGPGGAGRPTDWAGRLSARLPPPDPEPELGQPDRVLPEGWAERLREMDPDRVSESVRRGRPLPEAAPTGLTGPVIETTFAGLADRLHDGETGWQYFYQVQEGDLEGIWVRVGRIKPHSASPGQMWLYGPGGQYLDQRSAAASAWVRRET